MNIFVGCLPDELFQLLHPNALMLWELDLVSGFTGARLVPPNIPRVKDTGPTSYSAAPRRALILLDLALFCVFGARLVPKILGDVRFDLGCALLSGN